MNELIVDRKSSRRKYHFDTLREAASLYSTRQEFKRANRVLYNVATRYGVLDDICGHMPKDAKLKWSDEALVAEAAKYLRRVDFEEGSPRAYEAARRRGLLDHVCAHMNGNVRWTDEQLAAEAAKYTCRKDFEIGSPSAYRISGRRGIREEICAHMDGNVRWTKDLIMSEAQKHQTRKEFERGSLNAYYAAQRRGILDEICAHMDRARYGTSNDAVYIWRVKNTKIYKVGITSSSLGALRMNTVAEFAGVAPELILQTTTKGRASEVETDLLRIGVPFYFRRKFAGHTEFRVWTEEDLRQALDIVVSNSWLYETINPRG